MSSFAQILRQCLNNKNWCPQRHFPQPLAGFFFFSPPQKFSFPPLAMATVNHTIQLLTISTMQFQCVLSNASCLPNVIHMLPHPPSPSLYHPFPPQTHTISLFPRVCVCVWVCSVSSCCHFVAYFCARSSANWIYALQAMGKTLAKSWAGSCIDFVMSRWRRGRGRGRVTGEGDRAWGHRRVHGLCTLDAHKILSFWHHINCSSHKFPCILHSPGLWASRTELRGWS